MEDKYIGNYKILEKIGAGGMAQVYLAVHKDVPNLKVVLKILSDSRMADRFRQEADKLALLDGHQNICRIKHFFNHGDDLVIAMDYIDGQTLEEMIVDNQKLPTAQALKIIIDVLSILEFAHEKGISHRDIKPGNIMIDKSGQVKIIDFGIAKGKSDPNLTIAGTCAGTPLYMAPEQFASNEGIDYAPCDIYATGTTLFKMLTGGVPFKGDNEFALRDSKLFDDPVKPSSMNPEIGKELEGIILRSINKEPEKRFGSAGEMSAALKQVLNKIESVPEDLKKTSTYTSTTASRKGKSKVMPAFIGAAFLAIAAFVLFKFILTGEEKPIIDKGSGQADTAIAGNSPMASSTGTLELAIDPSGDISIDGDLHESNATMTTLNLDTGRHVIEISNNGSLEKRIYDTVMMAGDQYLQKKYTFTFKPADDHKTDKPVMPVRPDFGKLVIGSKPRGADIFIDGQKQKEQTPYTFTIETGEHIVKLMLYEDGHWIDYYDTVMVTKDGESKVFYRQ